MDFQYNGHLTNNERITQVANEIIKKYPQISMAKAKIIAMSEGKISTNKTANMELHRLYNIMLINQKDRESNIIIYKDYLNILNNNHNEDIKDAYYDIIEEINNYFNNNASFPFINY